MKERPIFPLLVSMALPMVLSMTVNALYNIVDSFFVAQISEQAMTALSLVYPVQNMINAIAIGFGVGINALIALYSGAGDRCRADTAATHGLVFSILHGLIAAVVCIAMMPGFLRLSLAMKPSLPSACGIPALRSSSPRSSWRDFALKSCSRPLAA